MSVLTTKGWVKARLDVVHERLDEMKAENAAFAFFLGERACENRKAHEELSLKVESLSKEFANDNFSITQRLNAIEGLNRMYDEMGEMEGPVDGRWIVRNISNLYQRLDAPEDSLRSSAIGHEVHVLRERIDALEARVALCGGISETTGTGYHKSPYLETSTIRIDDGEGPVLRSFVNWLFTHYTVATSNRDLPDLLDEVTKEQLIGEYLVYRAGFGGE